MEQFSRTHPPQSEHSRVSSVSSLDSINDSAHSGSNGSIKPVHARSVSAMPSYMRNAPIKRKPVSPKAPQTELNGSSNSLQTGQKAANASILSVSGTLLLAIAALPHTSVLSYVQSILLKSSYKQIMILALLDYEVALKQLKIDIYALLGKLGLEVRVELNLRTKWTEPEVELAVSEAVAEGDMIHAVLCDPDYDSVGTSSADAMRLDQEDLASQWKCSTGFLHTTAKYTLPSCPQGDHEHKQPGLFLVTSPIKQSPMSSVYNAACRALMILLVEANASKNLTVDYAENVLSPEPESKPTKLNGGLKLPSLEISKPPRTEDDPPPESPTKLWALYNDMWVAD